MDDSIIYEALKEDSMLPYVMGAILGCVVPIVAYVYFRLTYKEKKDY